MMSDFGKDINVPVNDCISRQDAIEAITNYAKFLWDNYHETCHLAGMIDTIDALPTAEMVGKWINYKDEHCCSVCDWVIIEECWDEENRYDYCPHCGARMAEGEEG